MEVSRNSNKPLSVFALVMINIIAVDSLRNLATAAEFGTALIFYYLFCALVFFIPTALVAAELATGWPKTGGLYIWVSEAFSYRTGFLAIWLQWVYNIVWYPTILSFVAATIAYLISPTLANNVWYMLPTVLGIFYLATIANLFGIRISSWISIFGAIVGTLLPMAIIIALGCAWWFAGNPSHIDFSWQSLWPDFTTPGRVVFVSTVLFSLMGIEMSGVHAGDVSNPQRDYPRALLISTVLILFSLIFAALAIALVIPQKQLSLVSGLLDAYAIFFKSFHMAWMQPIIAILIIIGAISGVAAWIIGPTRGLLIAVQDSDTLTFLQKTNRYGAPQNILLLQMLIFTLMCSAFLLMPTINSSYVVLSALTEKLALLVYLLIFAAAIVLRYKQPHVPRTYRVPGGNVGIWVISVTAIVACLAILVLGFVPPEQVDVGNIWQYETLLLIGLVICCLPPFLLTRNHQDKT